jgi:hypothetical protein
MYVCMLRQDGEIVVHRTRPTSPAALLQTIAPYRTQSVLAGACLCTWSWLAALCARAGLPLGLGHALSLHALHGGKAPHDTSDAQQRAVRRRGGMLPQASVYAAEMRATRDWLRRRRPRTRQRVDLWPQSQQPHRQDHWPESGPKSAYQSHCTGVAARGPDPAVPKRLEVDLALSDSADQ